MQERRSHFDYEDLLACGRGELFAKGPQLPLPPMLMFDRISEIAEVGGEYGNVPIATYHDIGQYWPYTEAEFRSFAHTYNDSKDKLTDCAWLLAKK